jgi:hypothetical protein
VKATGAPVIQTPIPQPPAAAPPFDSICPARFAHTGLRFVTGS